MEKVKRFHQSEERILLNRYLFLFLCFILSVSFTLSFNLDTQSIIVHHGPNNSMFGFSVAQHRDKNISWILVGAPEADSRQPGIEKAGAVFRCSCESSDTCQLIPFDRSGNNLLKNNQIDEKSGQWFGATVKSSGEDGIILACAPRYTWFTTNFKRRDPVGTCFVAKDSFTEFVEYSPCRTTKWGYHRQGSCQVGLGADVDPAGRRVFLGAVGSWYWQGQMFMVDSKKSGGSGSPRAPFLQFVPPGQLHSQSSILKPDIKSTTEGPSWDDDSYLGYSVASGEFSGDEDSDVAVGMPRGGNLTGKVVIYSSELLNLHNITGEQIGAYFGYSLCVVDVDGDGLDDIVIGAPMYTDYQDTAMKIETGRVYVVYQNKRHKFKRWDSLDGTAHRGRFGLSLATLGDINRDGIDDFAVGAPYDGLYGRGAVYIFQGTQDGVRREHSQVIHGSNLNFPYSVSTFGFSLSGGRDLDGNGYPDLIVGAYDSNIVTLLRSRPVVRVRSKLTFTSGKQINLDEKRCTLRDGKTWVACFPLNLCMSYDGFGADDAIDFNVQYILDSKKTKEQRMFFLNNEGTHTFNSTVRLRKNVEECSNTQVYIRPQIRDKLTPIEAELRYSMIESRARRLSPVIDVGGTTERDSVSIRKECGPDNVCVPDLRLRVSQSDASFIMGSTERIWIELEVYNNGEDSFESMLYIQVPSGLSYVSADPLDTRKDVPILCSAPTPSTNNTMRCDIGNPLPAFAKAKFRVYFQTSRHSTDLKKSYDFIITANSTNPEEPHRISDNSRKIIIPIEVETKVEIYGSSKPQPVPYNVSLYTVKDKYNESHIGPEVIHVYDVRCLGPSNIEEATVTILWPSFTKDNEHFLYLLEDPIIDGPGVCEPINTVNPLGIKTTKQNKFISHTSDTTVNEGEGRRRNFTHSSEFTTDGGSYTQTYRNTSYESTRKTSSSSGSGSGLSRGGTTTRITSSEDTLLSGSGSYSRGGGGGYDRESTEGRRDENPYVYVPNRETSRNENPYVYVPNRESPPRNENPYVYVPNRESPPRNENPYVYVPNNTPYIPKYGERGYTGSSSGGGVSTIERTYTRTDPVSSFSGGGGGESIHRSSTSDRSYGRNDQVSSFNGESSIGRGGGGRVAGGGGSTYSEERTYTSHGPSHTRTTNTGGTTGGGYSRTETVTFNGRTHHEGGESTSNGRGSHGRDGFSTNNGRGAGGEGESDYDGSEENVLEADYSPRRHKRVVDDVDVVDCGNAKCTRIRCKIGPLTTDSSVTFYLRGRVYADTLQTRFRGESVEVASKLITRVTQLPYNVSPDFLVAKELTVVSTIEEQIDLTQPQPIPWWIYLLAIIAGILFLCLLIFLLYKCGFFKRRRPNTTPEGQPLHRNGYQSAM